MARPDRITPLPPVAGDEGRSRDARSAAIDWDHLSRQTFGDGELEKELLTMFARQAGLFAARLGEPARGDQNKWRGDVAHTLKGSARAIGAFELAAAAEAYETALNGGADEPADRLRELGELIRTTQKEIAARLERF